MTNEFGIRDWRDEALCRPGGGHEDLVKNFFSANPDKKYEAKNLCFECPVRRDCIKYALEHGEIWGIWGGRDDNELRRALSVNAEGNEIRRGRYPQCPYCSARTSKLKTRIIDLPNGGRWTTAKVVECTVCGFEWRSRSSANAVNLYHLERQEKAERSEELREEKKKRAPEKKPASSVKSKE